MATTELASDRELAEIQRIAYAGLDADSLRLRVLERLRRVVPIDGYVAFTMDPTSSLITSALVEAMGDERGLRTFLEHVYFDDEILDFRWMTQHRLAAASLSEATGGKPEQALRFRELIGPAGFGFEARAAFTTGGELWGGFCLTREPGRADFDDRDLAFLRRIAPHVSAGLRAATLQVTALVDDAGEATTGVIVLDPVGRVTQHNAAAERWLQDLGGLGPQWREGREIPTPVWSVLGALRRTLHPETDRDRTSVPLLHVQGRSGLWLTLQASLTEGSQERLTETVVVIAPAGPKQVFRLATVGYGLSPREQEVVDLVVRGASSKQIADQLFISEYTVKDHLVAIFDKVGVRGRRELVKRLYLNTVFA